MEAQTKNKDKSSSAPKKHHLEPTVQEDSDEYSRDALKKKEADEEIVTKIQPTKGSVDEWSVTWP